MKDAAPLHVSARYIHSTALHAGLAKCSRAGAVLHSLPIGARALEASRDRVDRKSKRQSESRCAHQ